MANRTGRGFGRGSTHSEESKEKMSVAKTGIPHNVREDNPRWSGGRFVSHGYVYVHVGRDHPMANKNGCAPEHRLVMSGIVGRVLSSDETVHHIDGDKTNNSPENLQLRKGRHGKGVSYMCGDCGSINVLSIELGAADAAHKAMARAGYSNS